MPKYYEDKEEDNRACAGIREDFKACLLQHDCVVKDGKLPSECLKEGHCKALQTSFFECRGQCWTRDQDSEERKDTEEPSKFPHTGEELLDRQFQTRL
nr:cytochrome c oxidase assembly factor 5-like [Labrus bergylta]